MRALNFLVGGDQKTANISSGADLAKQQELINRFNINSAFGSRTFTKDASGREVLNINETPFQMQTRAAQEGLATSFLSSLSGGDSRFGTEAKRIGDLTFERGMSRLQPTLDARRRATETQLATQGLPQGSEAQRSAIDELGRNENDLLSSLAQTSELAAGDEQSRLRGLASSEAAGFFGSQFGGLNMDSFNDVNQIDRAGIIGAADTRNLERSKMEAARREQRRKNAIDLGTKAISAFTGAPTPA